MQRRSVLKGAALLGGARTAPGFAQGFGNQGFSPPIFPRDRLERAFSCLDHIHMTEPYHGLMAKQWLKALLDASTPR